MYNCTYQFYNRLYNRVFELEYITKKYLHFKTDNWDHAAKNATSRALRDLAGN